MHFAHPPCWTPWPGLLQAGSERLRGLWPGSRPVIAIAVAFLLLRPEAGDTDGLFVDVMGCGKRKHKTQKTLATQRTHGSVRQARGAASVAGGYHAACRQLGGRASFDLRFLLNLYCFRSTVRPKNHKSNRHKSGLSVIKLTSAP